jgi:alkylation response protein AidB-like acyl-CoA dehydrogenase
MRFGLSEQQSELQRGVAEFLAAECPPAYVRQRWSGAPNRALWKKLADLGVTGMLVPTQYGGLGLSEVEAIVVLEAAGYVALPEPLLETALVGTALLVEAGTDEQRQTWLPRIARGEALVTTLLGADLYAVGAVDADLLLIEREGALYAMEREKYQADLVETVDPTRRLSLVTVKPLSRALMAGSPELVQRAVDRGAAGAAALLTGIAQWMLDTSVTYAKARHQFDRPIGSFQAVKHKLAETLVMVEAARATCWYAGYSLAMNLNDASEAASIAKAYASDAESKASDAALQIHGGIGFTWEHDLHLWMKRGKALEQAHGSASWHRKRLAQALHSRKG